MSNDVMTDVRARLRVPSNITRTKDAARDTTSIIASSSRIHIAYTHIVCTAYSACLQRVAELDAGENRIGETRGVDNQQDEVDVAVGQLALQVRLREVDARACVHQLAEDLAVAPIVACVPRARGGWW